MKKALPLLLLFSLFVCTLPAQSYDVDWGPVYKKEGGLWGLFNLIGLEGDNYYLLTGSQKNNTLVKFNLKHRLVGTEKIDSKYRKEKLVLDRFVRTTQGTFAYYISRDKKSKSLKLYISDFDRGRLSTPNQVYEHQFKVQWSFTPFGITSYTNSDAIQQLTTSSDSSQVVFVNPLSSKDKGGAEKVAIAVFDADMKLKWEKRQAFKYSDKDIQIEQTVISNKGEVFLLARLYNKKKYEKSRGVKKKGLPRFAYRIFRITKDDFQEYDLKLGSRIAPTDAGLFFPKGEEKEFLVAGFYTDEERKSGLKGIFFARGTIEGGEIQKNIKEFDDAFLEDIISKKRLEKDRGLETSYALDRMIEFGDGSYGFLAENTYVTVSTTTNAQGQMRQRYTYHSDEIIIPRFSSEGEFMNIQKIEKYFRSSSRANTSYAFALYDNKVYLVYNDMKTGEERRDLKKGGSGKKGRLYTDLTIVNSEGAIETQTNLFNNKDIELTFVPFLFDFEGSTMILGSISARKYAFGTMKLD